MRLLLCVAFLGTILTNLTWQRAVPPAFEAKDCNAPVSKDELPNSRFARKGGKETKINVRYEEGLLTTDNVEQGRDLSQYERLNFPESTRVNNLDWVDPTPRVRIFIWDHWHNQKPGYVTMTLSSVDATSTSHIFVEKDNSGKWRVAWRVVRHDNRIHDLPTYYGVEWVRPGGWREPGIPLSPGEQPDPKKHQLQFRDKCGDPEHSF